MPKVKRSSSQCQPASTHGRGRGSASTRSRGHGSASTCGRGREDSHTLPTPSGDSGPSASLDGSAGEELPVHIDRLMAVICAEVEKITQSLGGVSSSSAGGSSSSAGTSASSVGAPSASADQTSAGQGGLQSSVGQQYIVPPQLTLTSYPGRVRRSFM